MKNRLEKFKLFNILTNETFTDTLEKVSSFDVDRYDF
jgi:hypothetical protein